MTAPYVSVAWAQPAAFGLRWKFDTDVLTKRDGTEQRIAGQGGLPTERISVSFELGDLETDDADERAADLRRLRADLFVDSVSAWGVPFWHEGAPAAAAITGTTATVNATNLDWIAEGQRVLVQGVNPEDVYDTEIDDASGGTTSARVLVFTDSPPAGDFSAAMIYPIATTLMDRPVLSQGQGDVGSWELAGIVTSRWEGLGTGASVATFDGIPVLTKRPIMGGQEAEEQILTDFDRQERGGAVEQTEGRDVAQIARLHNFVSAGAAEWAYWKKFLATVRGKQVPFLLPTWRHDLVAVDTGGGVLQGDTHVFVTNPTGGPANAPDYLNDYYPGLAHRHLQFLFSDGSVAYRTVATVGQFGDDQRITLTSAIDEPVGATLERISFMELVRLGGDEISFSVNTARVVRFGLSFVVVQDTIDTPPATFDEAEESAASSVPIELVKVAGLGVAYYMTNNPEQITYDTHDYTVTPISRSDYEVAAQGDQPELVFTLPLSHALVQAQAFSTSAPGLTVTVYRQHPGIGTITYISERPITGFQVRGKTATMRAPAEMDDPFDAQISNVDYRSRLCRHQLYNSRCGASRAAHDQATTITNITGRVIQVASIGALGEVGEVWTDDGEKRMVVSVDPTDPTILTLSSAFIYATTSAPHNAVTVYEKCDRTPEECRDTFSNMVNFSGEPGAPRSNPFTWNIFGPLFV